MAKEPWEEGLGNHRAVVRVEQKADAALVKIPWRRRDRDPERKQIIVVDSATSQRVTNVARVRLDRFEGVLAFQPQTVPGEYFVYYLPFKPQPGYGNYNYDYLPPQDTAAPEWKARLPQDIAALPQATVVRLEARKDFDSFYPMEVVATHEETQGLLDRSPAAYLLFPEDRRFPIRMTDELPLRWVKSGPAKEFRGEAQRNEFYVFQIGVWAARTNLAGLEVVFEGEMAGWLRCFNTGGTNWDCKPFRKTLDVPQGKVQALWIGVDVPPGARPGEHRAEVTIRPKQAPPATVQLNLKVLPEELADRGDGDLWRLARLRWLDSTLGATLWPPNRDPAWQPHPNEDKRVRTSSHVIEVRNNEAFPASILACGRELLSRPMRLTAVLNQGTAALATNRTLLNSFLSASVNGEQATRWMADTRLGCPDGSDDNSVRCESTAEADGHIRSRFVVKPGVHRTNQAYEDLGLEIPLRPDIAACFMGLGLSAGKTPTNYTWRWTGPYNSFWVGNARAGLHVKLLGSTYEGPMQNLYHPKPPPSWFNGGKGGVTLTNGPDGEVLVRVFTGPFELKAGEERAFDFALLVTPVKPLDPAAHFRERYWHSTAPAPDGINVINVHHATAPNPFINYPFLAVDKLRQFCRTNQAAGRKVKIYYTVRELTSHLPELWALRSLGDEVLAGGPGGGYPWLREHLGAGYTTAWYTAVEGGEVDAAILTSGASRWYNFYVEGLNWLARNVPIDGLYLDDVAYDRTILKRMRKVLDRARPGCLIDLHSNTLFSMGPANQYTEFFPYVDRLWFGEGFKYDAMSPEQWLVECSGIPFGLMGDMLEGGGNPWRGMLFGMTLRLPWPGFGPRAIWKVWDDFGIGEARMLGWWDAGCPVRTGRDDVLATAYVKPGRTLIALASWAPGKSEVRLKCDWQALELDASKARLVAPEIPDFQPAREWRLDEPIPVEPKRGWLIYLAEPQSPPSTPPR
ncbi:MAG TPA: DUF6067 family protein [Verrucomicrobiota bacterium]|nr:DUF6067 family protein [Verrucomicrobiota bacterium]HQL79007.1 DUF6067 family protein [Verrucomicrobiota bacterium]